MRQTETGREKDTDTETMAWLGIYLATVNGIFIFEINKQRTRDMRQETSDRRQETEDMRQRGLSLHAN